MVEFKKEFLMFDKLAFYQKIICLDCAKKLIKEFVGCKGNGCPKKMSKLDQWLFGRNYEYRCLTH